jgi:hypothetical protein
MELTKQEKFEAGLSYESTFWPLTVSNDPDSYMDMWDFQLLMQQVSAEIEGLSDFNEFVLNYTSQPWYGKNKSLG